MKIIRYFMLVQIAMIISITNVYSEEEIYEPYYLKGKVVSITEDKVKINVMANFCKGERSFVLSPNVGRKYFKEGKVVVFIVNEKDIEKCKSNEEIEIVNVGRN